MIYWLALILGGVALLVVFWPTNSEQKNDYLEEANRSLRACSIDEAQQAVDLKALSDKTFVDKLKARSKNVKRQLGKMPEVKLLVYSLVLVTVAMILNNKYLQANLVSVASSVLVLGWMLGYLWLQKRQRQAFESAFPDALNMLSSAVSSGESIMHAIIYVGRTLQGEVGSEFKHMGERLQLGETPDNVFRKSCDRFPYPSFYFFVITLRANMQRGGQLKDVIARLNRLMFDARAIEKKKYALTAEARMSAKIVAVIPFSVLLMLQFVSPDNFEFLLFDPEGKPILYYLISSEFIGLFIIWSLMRGAQR
ncbi:MULTISPECIES: type II secretion system F family protein [Vibrio]|uniref:Pilus assembly protein TadB n=1 Tax=Vibrio bivalvicida TaxID=1276888 RepID=A0A177Y424_9VIBR|nr:MULTISPECIES: type II secretion system F family protein [Vibrio]KLN63254.1 pilus assembly protein TadB [Vibrio sp. VPAP30]OAJ95591.1 pilus assembly protein TadB [Vibrio bivalvicida]